MRIPGLIGKEDWNVILDTINEFSEDPEPLLDLKKIYNNSLAKYRMPGMFLAQRRK